jgi:hypothetical protein
MYLETADPFDHAALVRLGTTLTQVAVAACGGG